MPSRSRTLTLDADLSHVPATRDEAEELVYYDVNHRDCNPVKRLYVSEYSMCQSRLYRVRIGEMTPWAAREVLDLSGRHRTASAAAREVVRYLKWRLGPAWRRSRRSEWPAVVDSFNDEVRTGYPPVWAGRIWVAGNPVLAFADRREETGFASAGEAQRVAMRLVELQMPTTWRNYLGRYPRPFAEPMPAGALTVPDTIRAEELLRRPEVDVPAVITRCEADRSVPVAH